MASEQKRNPVIGGIIAAVMIGFGVWRLYAHYVNGEEMPGWRLILSGAMIAYGLFVGYQVLTQNKSND